MINWYFLFVLFAIFPSDSRVSGSFTSHKRNEPDNDLSLIFFNKHAGIHKFPEVQAMSGILYNMAFDDKKAKKTSNLLYYRIPRSERAFAKNWGCLTKNSFCELKPDQCVTILPDYFVLGDKFRMTELMYSFDPDDLKENEWYYPRSYRLFDEEDRNDFISELVKLYGPSVYTRLECCLDCYEEEKRNNNHTCPLNPDLFIMKCGNSAEAKGMFSMDPYHMDDLFFELYDEVTIREVIKRNKYISQRYIGKLWLYESRKCHSRKHFLILSVDPLNVVSYPTGNTFCGRKGYTIEDGYTDIDILSSNHGNHKSHGIVRDTQVIDIWPEGYRETTFNEETNRIISHISKMFQYHVLSEKSLHRKYKRGPNAKFPHYSGLLGIDILVDENLKPWVTEVQTMGRLSPVSGNETFNTTETNLFKGEMAVELLTILDEFCRIRNQAEDGNKEIAAVDMVEMKSVKKSMWIIKDGKDLYPRRSIRKSDDDTCIH